MANKVEGELYESITGQIFEIGRQLRQPKGYPFDPVALQKFLQRGVEGRFTDVSTALPRRSKPKWKVEADGSIIFTVKSDGTTGEAWTKRLTDAGHKVGDYGKELLRSADFKPTKGVVTKLIVFLPNCWSDRDRLTRNIRAKAVERLATSPNPEVACLIRMMFSNDDIKAMGLTWLIVMNEPIRTADGGPRVFGVGDDCGNSWLRAYWDFPDYQWLGRNGFVFVVSQV